MADYKTHISVSTVLGVGYGAVAYFAFDIPMPHCCVAAALCGVAGMLPDLDSNSGIPQREMLSFVAVVVPMLMMDRFHDLSLSPEHLVFIAGVMYAIIRFGVGGLFRRYTRHRGMWHSIPAALIAGMLTFLIVLSHDINIRLFKSWAVVLGFVSHLILDELYSVDWQGRKIRIKKSFGTALKWVSTNRWANMATYGKLALLCVLIASDGAVMSKFGQQPLQIPWSARDWVHDQFPNHDESEHTYVGESPGDAETIRH